MKLLRNDIWNKDTNNHYTVFCALYFGFLGGCVNVLVDIDHLLYFAGWENIPYEILAGRPLHITMVVLAGCLFLYSIARLSRLGSKLVLKAPNNDKTIK
jgi:hypothetical protein